MAGDVLEVTLRSRAASMVGLHPRQWTGGHMSFPRTVQQRVMALTCGVAITLAGCTRWHEIEWPKASGVAPRHSALRVTKLDSSHVVVWAPRLAHDSLVGKPEWGQRPVVVPLDSIHSVAARRFDGMGTAFVGLGLGAVTVAALCLGGGICFSSD